MKNIFLSVIFLGVSGFLLSFFVNRLQGKVPVHSIWHGKNSSVFMKKIVEIDSQSELNNEWNQLLKTDRELNSTAPVIDFKKKKILICYAGDATNGLQIDSAVVRNETLWIYERNISLGSNCNGATLLITPFEIIQVDRANWKEVKEDCRVLIQDCK